MMDTNNLRVDGSVRPWVNGHVGSTPDRCHIFRRMLLGMRATLAYAGRVAQRLT